MNHNRHNEDHKRHKRSSFCALSASLVPFVYVPDFLGKAAKPTQSFSSLVRFPPRIISFWSSGIFAAKMLSTASGQARIGMSVP